tara:strand:- start:328 stop:516 length:189 start_codon:yes stop_codon:yes gene_type:complete
MGLEYKKHTLIKKINKMDNNLKYCEQCGEDQPIEHICFTCCGIEITTEIQDFGLCPECLEHI